MAGIGSAPPISEELARAADELRAVIGQLMRRMRAASSDELTPTQACVVSRLDRDGPANLVDLARAEVMRPQSMAATLDALVERGIVARTPDRDDRRRVVFALTEKGKRILERRCQDRQDWLARQLATRLNAAERRQLLDAVGLLKRLTMS